jgi:histone H3/H4
MVSTGIAKASVKRIAFEATGSPIGADAVDKLAYLADEFIRGKAGDALKMAKHAGRKTIKAIDIQ